MAHNTLNGATQRQSRYETPFADPSMPRELDLGTMPNAGTEDLLSFESPFTTTYAVASPDAGSSPFAMEQVQLAGELHDVDFSNNLYEMAVEMEDTWLDRISNEAAMGSRYIPFARQQADQYMARLVRETDLAFDRINERFSGPDLASVTDQEVEAFFTELEDGQRDITPIQDQFFGKLVKKAKSVVKKGISLAKKGIRAVSKFLPHNIILNKLKKLVRPILEKVLKFALNKLPKNLQPFAQTLAGRLIKKVAPVAPEEGTTPAETPATGDLDQVQTDLDQSISNLVFARNESEADELLYQFEHSDDGTEREMREAFGSAGVMEIQEARRSFVNELKSLPPGADTVPVFEKFIPAAIMAAKPLIKMALNVIGRQKVVNFLASLIAQLAGKFVPANVAKPLSVKIVDVGLNALGLELQEGENPDLAYEALASTIEDTFHRMGELDPELLDTEEELTDAFMIAFEAAAADHFPAQYVRAELKAREADGVWVLMPRNGAGHYYKKYSRIFPVTISPSSAKNITVFRGLSLAHFLKDKLGLDPSQPITANVHLYEAIDGTRLSRISRFEEVPGLGRHQPFGWKQLHPLTREAATLLLQQPQLGTDVSPAFLNNRYKIALKQRFYYLQIDNARLRIPAVARRINSLREQETMVRRAPSHSGDIQGTIDFIQSSINLSYYFSEEEAKSIVEQLNSRNFPAAAAAIRSALRSVLQGVLLRNPGSKVKIIHEAYPEMYWENEDDAEEHFSLSSLKKTIGGFAAKAGKQLVRKILSRITGKISGQAYKTVLDFFRTRANEFVQAQSQPEDGVTIRITWSKVPGLGSIRTVLQALKGKPSLDALSDLRLPEFGQPEIKVLAGKNLE